jgi:C6 transcription factor Pro1
MSGPLRSKKGCWTCRLRKKKCDEDRPYCSTCESLSITCYGFGPKPDWMDNGEKERVIVNSLKDIVKHTSRRRATAQVSTQRDPVIRIAPKSSNGPVEISSSHPDSRSHHRVYTPLDSDVNQDSHSPQDGDHSMHGSIFSIPADESVLLMHFLDNVLPLQYPMYKPSVLKGGRGWLLALLLRTRPLYYAALAFSAYHCRTIMLEIHSHPCQVTTLIQQEKYLGICITAVHESAQNSCPKGGLGILASVVQLVFFEV